MDYIDSIFIKIGANFGRDSYYLLTKIQGILWSIANTLLVFYFLKIVGIIRMKNYRKRIRVRYYFLGVTAILSPFLLVTRTGYMFFYLEAAIYGIQYAILLYTLVLERRALLNYFREIVSGKT